MRLSNETCSQARTLIASRLGLDFPEGRWADLARGFVGACHAAGMTVPEVYLAWLATLPNESPEWQRLGGHLTVGETFFLRDRAAFTALEEHVLAALVAARRAQGNLRLRLWSAACATGEEPYSLAILLDRLLPDRSDWALTILATDINRQALEVARSARYRDWSFRDTPTSIRDHYFHRWREGVFELDASVRQLVTFAPLNLAEDGYPSLVTNTTAMDLILCRNVLMYFTREAQLATVGRLQRALAPGGWLVVSPAEASSEVLRPLRPVNFSGAIFYRYEPATVVSPQRGSGDAIALQAGSGAVGFEGTAAESAARKPPATPTDAATSLERARSRADHGDLDGAHQLVLAALAENQLNPEAHLLLAAICQERGDIVAALEALRRAIYVAPDCAPAHFLLGTLLVRQGDRRRGRRSMQNVVRLLSMAPRDEVVPDSDGLTAGRLREVAQAHLELQ